MHLITFQELVSPLDPQFHVLRVVGPEADDARSLVVLGAKVQERTGLGEGERGEQVDEEHDEQENEETAHVLVNLLLCIDVIAGVGVGVGGGVSEVGPRSQK